MEIPKLLRESSSSGIAKILAGGDPHDIGLYLKAFLEEISYRHELDLANDSRSWYSRATTAKEPEEQLNNVDIATVRESFGNGELDAISWFPRYYMVADALKKGIVKL